MIYLQYALVFIAVVCLIAAVICLKKIKISEFIGLFSVGIGILVAFAWNSPPNISFVQESSDVQESSEQQSSQETLDIFETETNTQYTESENKNVNSHINEPKYDYFRSILITVLLLLFYLLVIIVTYKSYISVIKGKKSLSQNPLPPPAPYSISRGQDEL